MRYVAAYLLAVLGGKTGPSQTDIEKILSSVGIEADAEKLKKVISELNGKSIDELIAQGIIIDNFIAKGFIFSFSFNLRRKFRFLIKESKIVIYFRSRETVFNARGRRCSPCSCCSRWCSCSSSRGEER